MAYLFNRNGSRGQSSGGDSIPYQFTCLMQGMFDRDARGPIRALEE
jgi:hypothetical protein